MKTFYYGSNLSFLYLLKNENVQIVTPKENYATEFDEILMLQLIAT